MEPTARKLTMGEPAVFRICIQGALDNSWADYLGLQAISVEVDEAGIAATLLTTEPVDQAGLVGLINRLNSLALPLLSVETLPGAWAEELEFGRHPTNCSLHGAAGLHRAARQGLPRILYAKEEKWYNAWDKICRRHWR